MLNHDRALVYLKQVHQEWLYINLIVFESSIEGKGSHRLLAQVPQMSKLYQSNDI